ncbi:hypothetical protein DICA1_E28150 [Diutina catenulata]
MSVEYDDDWVVFSSSEGTTSDHDAGELPPEFDASATEPGPESSVQDCSSVPTLTPGDSTVLSSSFPRLRLSEDGYAPTESTAKTEPESAPHPKSLSQKPSKRSMFSYIGATAKDGPFSSTSSLVTPISGSTDALGEPAQPGQGIENHIRYFESLHDNPLSTSQGTQYASFLGEAPVVVPSHPETAGSAEEYEQWIPTSGPLVSSKESVSEASTPSTSPGYDTYKLHNQPSAAPVAPARLRLTPYLKLALMTLVMVNLGLYSWVYYFHSPLAAPPAAPEPRWRQYVPHYFDDYLYDPLPPQAVWGGLWMREGERVCRIDRYCELVVRHRPEWTRDVHVDWDQGWRRFKAASHDLVVASRDLSAVAAEFTSEKSSELAVWLAASSQEWYEVWAEAAAMMAARGKELAVWLEASSKEWYQVWEEASEAWWRATQAGSKQAYQVAKRATKRGSQVARRMARDGSRQAQKMAKYASEKGHQYSQQAAQQADKWRDQAAVVIGHQIVRLEQYIRDNQDQIDKIDRQILQIETKVKQRLSQAFQWAKQPAKAAPVRKVRCNIDKAAVKLCQVLCT